MSNSLFYSTTTASLPQLQADLVWSFYYLGTGIGEAGLITGDFNADGQTEIFIGSYGPYTSVPTTTLNIIQRNYYTHQVVWQEEAERKVMAMLSVPVHGTTYALLGQQDGLLSLYDLSRRVKVKTEAIFGKSEEIFKLFYADLERDGISELVVFGRKTDNKGAATLVVLAASFDAEAGWTERFRSQPLGTGDVALGAFAASTNGLRTDFTFASGEIFHLDPVAWSLVEVASFNTNLGSILQAFDVDGDRIDEVFGTQGNQFGLGKIYILLKELI